MKISRHYLTIKGRRVHYRRAGTGPALLMVHQSPRSSSEYEALMREWGAHFTCISPDSPGFGQSDPLANPAPEIEDFADALIEFTDAVGIQMILGYGFHSGGIILVTAMKRHMAKFRALAIGGYAIWNDEERAKIGPPYIPPNPPKAYGEHLLWLWNRILEQSWYFPWFEPSDANRMSVAHADIDRIDVVIQDMLNSGDAYRLGYGAVLRGGRDIPPPGAITPPVRITAYKGDPLEQHLARLADMPAGWEAYGVETPKAHQDESLKFLLANSPEENASLAEDDDQGFLPITTTDYDGLIHWQGPHDATRLHLHAPGHEAELVGDSQAIRIDLPGHGLSEGWKAIPPESFAPWQAVIDAVTAHFGTREIVHDPLPVGDPEKLYPDLSPDRFGHYLTKAWAIVRARHIFAPWYEANAANAIPIDPAKLAPASLAREHRALIRARAARALHIARLNNEGGS
jgi:pimeloyl-ACP methyl ester carboxylesterase